MNAEDTLSSSLTEAQIAVLKRLREMPDSEINYEDAPERPPGPLHPAAVLRRKMIRLDMGRNEMADALHVPVSSLDPILSIKGRMTADMAARLARYFGDTSQFWMDLQTQYDLAHVDQETIDREVIPAAS